MIDTTIIAEKDIYYRFTKDAATDSIKMDYGCDLQGVFTEVESESLNRVTGVEGPLAFLMPDGKTWCFMVDQFAKKLGYLPLLCENLLQGKFTALGQGEYDMGKNRKRHGSVLAISQEEYESVCRKYHA